MAPIIVKPENATKRAEELISVGQSAAALQYLYESMISKKYRTYSDAHETLMLRLLDLCVDLRKGKYAKESLHAFKNLSQNASVQPLENVVYHFLDYAEQKVIAAQQKSDKIVMDQIGDLDESVTPESVMLSLGGTGQDHKNRTDREIVTPWLKFLWESYRTLLDVFKYNAKLEPLYQQCVHKAFDFCLKYSRKTEMRRLCELLRSHLLGIPKYSAQQNSINLDSADSLQMHLDTRFIQLNSATRMELWQEAYRSVEDIHGLFTMSRTSPPPSVAANFFEQLIRIFLVADNYIFHAAAWSKFFSTSLLFRDFGAEHDRMCSLVLLSALVCPLRPSSHDQASKNSELCRFLNMNVTPSREDLIKSALGNNMLDRLLPAVKELYQFMEIDFHPRKFSESVERIFASLAQDTEMAKYIQPLRQVMLSRLIGEISKVYETVSFDFLHELSQFPAPYSMTRIQLEHFVLAGSAKGEWSIRLNHAQNSLTFVSDGNGSVGFAEQLSQLQAQLTSAISAASPVVAAEKAQKKDALLSELYDGLVVERENALKRKELIEKRKEAVENILQKKEREEAREKALKAQQEAEAEKVRLEEESRRRELERLKREREEIERQQTLKLAEEMKRKNVKIDIEDLENLDRGRLMQLQISQLEKEKKEQSAKMDALQRRVDHTERAYRLEEAPLIRESFEKQKKLDKEYHEKAFLIQVEASKRQHEIDFEIKKSLEKMKDEYALFKARILGRQEELMRERREEAAKNIAAAKQKRIEEVRAQRKEELIKEKKLAAERQAHEEEQARMRKEKELADQKRLESLRKDKEERLAQAEADRLLIQKRLELERAAEEKAKGRLAGTSSATSDGNAWRRPVSSQDASGKPPASGAQTEAPRTNKYVPPVPGSRPAIVKAAGSESTTSAYVPRGPFGEAKPVAESKPATYVPKGPSSESKPAPKEPIVKKEEPKVETKKATYVPPSLRKK